jgi:hypothetical protein
MNKFKLRSECYHDIDLFVRALVARLGQLKFTAEIADRPLPMFDMTLEFETKLGMNDIKEILKEVPDSHVMLETLALADEYTGERA